MALLKYLKPAKDCLPDLRGFMAAPVPLHMMQANLEVQQLLSDGKMEKSKVLTISKDLKCSIHTQILLQPF